ncbi:MAG: MerR family transcriptional regulator [Oscillospiraceae bacterium]|nr:MerR family transcriptional regulator [Oscillospiraceae bacterium]
MKINELATQAGLNTETIRKYRERGLIKPERNPENGYYEYSREDFLQLLYIRKLRGAHLSLDAIDATCSSGDAETLVQGYRTTVEALEEQIRQLKRREMMLRITAQHYERDAHAEQEIRQIESFDTKYDIYFGPEEPKGSLQRWVRNVDLFTLVLCIERRYFEEELPDRVPIRIGIGSYEKILVEENFPIPEEAHVFPKAQYAAFFLTVEDLDSIEGSALNPIRDYLRQEGLKPMSDTTAYLYRTDISRGKPRFVFCVRVMVQKVS